MGIKNCIKCGFLMVIVMSLILQSQAALGHICFMDGGGAVVQPVKGTLHIHDDIEVHKLFHHKPFISRRGARQWVERDYKI